MPRPDQPVLEGDGAVATLRLRRPAEHNRIDPDDLPVLDRHLERFAADPARRVLLIRGDGEKSFSSGYTLDAITSRLGDRAFEAFLNRLEALPKPTVAVIHGGIYGGATDLALCCDLRIGSTNSRMFMPAVRFGLHYYPDGLRRYVDRLGPSAARQLLLTGQTIGADAMLRIGFLNDCVAPEALEHAVTEHVARLLDADPGAYAAMKASLADLGAVDAGTRGRLEQRFLASMAAPALHERLARARPPRPARPAPHAKEPNDDA